MSLHLNDDDYFAEPEAETSELTLSTGALVGGVLAILLLCALSFALGYSLHHPASAVLPTAAAAEPAAPDADFTNFKPAAGSPLNSATAAVHGSIPAETPKLVPANASPAAPIAAAKLTSLPTQSASASNAASSTTGYFVQIAAVSHQQDAQSLAETLHGQGYLVTTRSEPQDKLFHVQIGPYANRRDAALIRQKLATEGYTPIVK